MTSESYIDKRDFFDTIIPAFCRKRVETALLAHRDPLWKRDGMKHRRMRTYSILSSS